MAKGRKGYKVRTVTCVGCRATVTKRCRPGTLYCSLACYRSGPRPQRRTGEDRTCERCGAGFYVPASRVAKGEGRYCSLDCHNAAQGDGKTEHTCKTCGGAFRWSPSRSASGAYRITYCSLACRDADPERRAMLLEMNTRQQLRRTTKAERLGYALLDGLGVEFDGDYWHDRKGTSGEARIRRRVSQDRSQDRYVKACGWEVVRLWESDLRDDPEACAARVSQLAHRTLPDAPARDPLAQA